MVLKGNTIAAAAFSLIVLSLGLGIFWFFRSDVIPECRFRSGTAEMLAKRYLSTTEVTKWPPILLPIGDHITLHHLEHDGVSGRDGFYYQCTRASAFVASSVINRECVNVPLLKYLTDLKVVEFSPKSSVADGKQIVAVSKGQRWSEFQDIIELRSPNEYELNLKWFRKFDRVTDVTPPKSNANNSWAVDFDLLRGGDPISEEIFKIRGTPGKSSATLEGRCQTTDPKGLVLRKYTPRQYDTKKINGMVVEFGG